MKKYLTMILSLFALNYGSAQVNLVPNGDFETYSICPNMLGQINRAVPWYDPGVSSDYYNACNLGQVGMPNNIQGSQIARSGNGYAGGGFFHSISPNVREYIQIELNDTLVAGRAYCMTFYVSLVGNSRFGIDGVGAFLSNTPVSPPCPLCVIDTNATIQSSTIITDTINWVEISGQFISNGGEHYLTIGNFNTDNETNKTSVTPSGIAASYYYVDDVSLYMLPEPLAGIDSTICKGDSVQIGDSVSSGIIYQWQPTTGLSDATISNPIAKPQTTTTYTLTISDTSVLHCNYTATDTVTIIVNDCTPPVIFFVPTILTGGQILNISGLPPNSKFTLYNGLGQLVLEQENYSNQFNAAEVSAGCYFYELEIPGENRQQGKICVVH